MYRLVDFKQNKFDIPARVETLEYDPYRTAFIAKILFKDGERRYVLASKEMKEGNEITVSEKAQLKDGNRLKLKNIPVGYSVYNVEISAGKGGQMARTAGSYAEVLAQENEFTHLKLSSGEVRRVLGECFASLGQVSNSDHNLVNIGKAGHSRHLGIRPTVRASVMNPVDHPYGGGEGRTQRGLKRPKTLWGKVTGGRKTRNKKKWSNQLIVKRRKKNK
jgi:large subunit ribosomal protein L2